MNDKVGTTILKNDPILIYGFPGSGKTTLIRRLAEAWGYDRCTGFFTGEIRKGGTRTGFRWQTFDNKQGILADLHPGTPRVGKYHVDLWPFEEMLPEIKVSAHKILLIDEVGKMECLSETFRSLLLEWEAADCHRIFTVPLKGTDFIESFKARNRAYLLELTPTNRDRFFATLLKEGVER